jgi:TRAP-type mannitol/chloroaromatic compound transport system substrate-binding protein
MGRIVVTEFISLDGVMEAPGGEPGYRNTGWTFKDIEFVEEAYELKGREQHESTAMLLGPVTRRSARSGRT